MNKYELELVEMEMIDPSINPVYGVYMINGSYRAKIIQHDRQDFLDMMEELDRSEVCERAVMCYWEDTSLVDWGMAEDLDEQR